MTTHTALQSLAFWPRESLLHEAGPNVFEHQKPTCLVIDPIGEKSVMGMDTSGGGV